MKTKLAIFAAIILPLMFTSCIKYDEPVESEMISVPAKITGKRHKPERTILSYQFIMGKWQWWPKTEPEEFYVDYQTEFGHAQYSYDKAFFDRVEVGDMVLASYYMVTKKSAKTGELYNQYYFRRIELP